MVWRMRCRTVISGRREIEQPMVAVDFAHGVRGAVGEDVVQILYFVFPVAVGADLAVWEHEGFAGVETSVDGR